MSYYFLFCTSMMSTTATKKGRATNEQLSQMVDYMLSNPGLAGCKFQKLHGKVECDRKWSELSTMLNSLGGTVKTVDKWRTVWKELKSRTSVKVRDRKRQQALTGNKPINQDPVSELERRVIALIGSDYIEGNKHVYENVPEKEEDQLLLEDGEDFILEMSPSPAASIPCDAPSCTTQASTARTPRRLIKRKRGDDSSGLQEQFLEIASKQADSLKMLAGASVASVEAARSQAAALETLSDSVAANRKVMEMLAESMQVVGEGMKVMGEGMKVLGEGLKAAAAAIEDLR